MKRKSWNDYFMGIAFATSERCSCFSESKGAVLVKDGRIISTGYNGAPSGITTCVDVGKCRKRSLGFGHGEGHGECKAVHAEANAILSAAKIGVSTDNCVLYCTHKPCEDCTKMLIQAGIRKVYYAKDYKSAFSDELINESGIELFHLEYNEGGEQKVVD